MTTHERPMHEKRAWGKYTVVHHLRNADGSEALTKHLMLHAGGTISYQYHLHRREVWVIVSGQGLLVLDGAKQQVGPGTVVDIPIGAKHALHACCALHFIEVQLGTPLIEEDIVRLARNWEDIQAYIAESHCSQ